MADERPRFSLRAARDRLRRRGGGGGRCARRRHAAGDRSETGRLSSDARERTAGQIAQQLARSYRAAGSWADADVNDALTLARQSDAVLVVRDEHGAIVVGDHRGRGRQSGRGRGLATVTRPIDAGGVTAGTAELRFRGGLTPAEALLRDHLVSAALLGSAIAVAIALAGAALVTRRLAEPLQRLTRAARGCSRAIWAPG